MPKKAKSKTGPAADRLKIAGNWKDAMKAATLKPKPKGSWPKK